MINQTLRGFPILLLVLVLQSSCATVGNEDPYQPSVIVKDLVKANKSWDGELLPPYPQGQPEITIRRISIPAGAKLESHSHPVINAGVLISGELTVVTAAGKVLNLKPGDPIIEVVNTVHYGVNEGKIPAEILVFYAGTVGTPLQVLK